MVSIASNPRASRLRTPRWLSSLFTSRKSAWVWLPVRLYVAFQWLWSGTHKLVGPTSVGWARDGIAGGKFVHHGDRLLAFWQNAAKPATEAFPQVAYPWYRLMLLFAIQHHWQSWFAYVIA